MSNNKIDKNHKAERESAKNSNNRSSKTDGDEKRKISLSERLKAERNKLKLIATKKLQLLSITFLNPEYFLDEFVNYVKINIF